MNGEKRDAYELLVRKSVIKRPLGRPKRRWVDKIKKDLRRVEFDDMDCIVMAQNRERQRSLVNTVLNLQIPLNYWNLLSGCTSGVLSRIAQIYGVNYLARIV
jgi:hypothetical protein